jgi:hypothetical protein
MGAYITQILIVDSLSENARESSNRYISYYQNPAAGY